MSHNKRYREIAGYEDALDKTFDLIDLLDEVKDGLTYGEEYSSLVKKTQEAKLLLDEVKQLIDEGKGRVLTSEER